MWTLDDVDRQTNADMVRTQNDPVEFTPKSIRNLTGPVDGKRSIIYFDPNLPGFGLRVTKSGSRAIILNYRAKGIERRMTLANVDPQATSDELARLLSDVRKTARRIKNNAKFEGIDPMAERHEDRQKKSMAELAERYLAQHAPKKRTSSQSSDRSMLKNHILPAFRIKRVEEIGHSDIDGLHRKISKTAPITANRTIALLSKMFSLAIRWGWRTDNPANGVERNPENRRQRYLKAAELERLSAALAQANPKASANAVRLLLLTGARRGEVLSATWEQFDLADGVWTKPSSHTKQKKEHRIPISAPARLLLSEMHVAAVKAAKKENVPLSPYVFPGAGTDGPQTDLKHFWASLCREAKLKDVRLHDLRHTYASVLASSGDTLLIIGAMLGHTNPATTARYAHLFDDPLRAATERAGAILSTNSAGAGGEVVRIGRQK